MAFLRPTLTEIIDRIQADIEAQSGSKVSTVRRSLLRILSRSFGGAVHLLYGFLDWNSKQLFPDTAEFEYLERWASLYGLSRTPAEYSEGNLTLTGTNSTFVPVGTKFQRADGVVVSTTGQVTIANGTALAAVRADFVGTAANTDAGQTLQAVSPQAGLTSAATVALGGLAGGVDTESDELLRARVLARLSEPPQGGAKRDYEQWAKEIAGVTRVWVKVPGDSGILPGEVKIYFAKDGNENPIPQQADINEVQAHIDEVRPVTAVATVIAPIAYPVAFNVHIYPNTLDVRTQVQAELLDLITREGDPEGILFLSRINEAISLATGEQRHVLVSPVADVTIPAGKIATLGTLTWGDI